MQGVLDMVAATVLRSFGRFEEALVLTRKAYELRVRLLGPEDPQTILALADTSAATFDLGNFAEALGMRKKVLVRTATPQTCREPGLDPSSTLAEMCCEWCRRSVGGGTKSRDCTQTQ